MIEETPWFLLVTMQCSRVSANTPSGPFSSASNAKRRAKAILQELKDPHNDGMTVSIKLLQMSMEDAVRAHAPSHWEDIVSSWSVNTDLPQI